MDMQMPQQMFFYVTRTLSDINNGQKKSSRETNSLLKVERGM